MNTTIYVDIQNHSGQTGYNVLAMVIKKIAFGATPVDDIIIDDREVDIAIVDTVEKALRVIKETEMTTILLVHLMQEETIAADGFASRYPGRVHSVHYIGTSAGEGGFVPFFLNLIAEKTKEKESENSVG